MKHIELLERVLMIFQNMHNFIYMKEIAHLQKDIQIYLDNYYADEDIDETLYEELDSRKNRSKKSTTNCRHDGRIYERREENYITI